MAPVSAIRKFGWLRSGIFFSLALGWIASAGPAQSECRGVYSKMCTPDTGSGGGGTSYDPPVYYPSPEEVARNQATELNNQGVKAYNRGDLREAIRLYELAVRTSASAINRDNLGTAYNNLGLEFAHKGDWEGALKLYLLAEQFNSDPVISDNVAKARAAIESSARGAEEQRAAEIAAEEVRRKEAQRQTDLAAAQQRTSELLANLRDNLPKQTWDGDSTSLVTGLDFNDGTAAPVTGEMSKIASPGLNFMDGTESANALFASYTGLARKLGWGVDEQKRLGSALNELDRHPADDRSIKKIYETWDEIFTRIPTGSLAEHVAKGEGPELFAAGAGQQSFNDCAVFALANAAQLPYGVVAARAAELLQNIEYTEDIEFRSAGDRKNAQQTIEKHGLNGGEVVMLAEEFGQVEIVQSTEFEKTLREGRPVMTSIVPKGGVLKGGKVNGHQVVLSKTFQYGGKTWYEMMDSNKGPLRRLYLSATELDLVLWENGVAFWPEPGTTTKLLR